MILYKPAAATCLGHSLANVTDSAQQLPDVESHDSARTVLIQNCDSLGATVWLTCDDSTPVANSHGIRLDSMHRLELTLDDLAKIKIVAPENEGCKVSVSYFR